MFIIEIYENHRWQLWTKEYYSRKDFAKARIDYMKDGKWNNDKQNGIFVTDNGGIFRITELSKHS